MIQHIATLDMDHTSQITSRLQFWCQSARTFIIVMPNLKQPPLKGEMLHLNEECPLC